MTVLPSKGFLLLPLVLCSCPQDWQSRMPFTGKVIKMLPWYVGGLDFIYLCYDTCAHKPGGRRYQEGTMPWHDCHCAVTGPAAWDVLEGALPCFVSLHSAVSHPIFCSLGFCCCCLNVEQAPACALKQMCFNSMLPTAVA